MAYTGTHVQGAAVGADAWNDTAAHADVPAVVVVAIALEVVEAGYSFRIVPSHGYPGKDSTPSS